jgi:octaprenyl-diphosphate synthase
VLLCGKLISEINDEHINFAAMVELIHMASLLHDDVIDKDSVRRGQASANALWGNTVAVLLGDFLLSRAFTLSALSKSSGAAAALGQTAQTLCTGELKQNLLKGCWELTEQDYFNIIEAKTAALFRCSCQLGAIASDASEDQVGILSEFGYAFGMAFQIADDLRDILSSEQREGKTVGTDFREEKLTLPVIHWIGHDDARRKMHIERLKTLKDRRQLTEQMKQTQSIDYAMSQAQQRVDKAKQILNGFASSPAQRTLLSLSDKIVADIH